MAAAGEFTGGTMKAETSLDRKIDWSDLDSCPLHLISQKLGDIVDLIRFRSVCNSWRLAIPKFDLSPRCPWFLQYRTRPEEHYLQFYSLLYNKTYTCVLEDQEYGAAHFSSCPASLVLNLSHCSPNQDHMLENFSTLVPMNRSQIIIPTPPRAWWRIATCYKRNAISYQGEIVSKGREYWALSENLLSGTKGRDLDISKDWIFKDEIYNGNGCAYFKGRYYSDIHKEGTKIIDITNGNILFTIPPMERARANSAQGFSCLIESSSGDLYKVFRPYDIVLEFEEMHFEIYRLVMNNFEQPFWMEVENIKDEVFFLDYSPQGLALNAGDFVGCKGNCIYFLKGELYEDDEFYFILCRYDLGDGKIETLPCPLKSWGTWVMPFVQ